jgi:lysophospholipase L1-like esterase
MKRRFFVGGTAALAFGGLAVAAVSDQGQSLVREIEFDLEPYEVLEASRFAAFGDSTTYGADLSDPREQRWTKLLGDSLEDPVRNFGSGGARSEEITAYLGGMEVTATARGHSIFSPLIELANLSVDPIRSGALNRCHVEVTDMETGQAAEGIIGRAKDRRLLKLHPDTPKSFFFGNVRMTSLAGRHHWPSVVFLGQGVNNEKAVVFDGTQSIDEIKSHYLSAAAVVDQAGGTLVPWGLLDRGFTERADTPVGKFIGEMETWLEDVFSEYFIPVRRLLASSEAIDFCYATEHGFELTSADEAAISVNTIPPCLRVRDDSVHLNALGHRVQAQMMYRYLLRL